MAVKFMVLGAPRSGTTWAANWLMSEGEVCHHDPFMNRFFAADPTLLDELGCGISCTSAVIQHREWVLNHPAPKVIVHRSFDAINYSLRRLGLPDVDGKMWDKALMEVPGLHVKWQQLFNPLKASIIFYHLTGRGMSILKHEQLRHMNVQPAESIIAYCKHELRRHVR
jgi:hypothetical protein